MKKSAAGFTLLELMTVVAILGVMATIAITSLVESQQRQDAAQEFTELESFLREARNNARVRMRCVKITMSSDTVKREEFEDCTEAVSLEGPISKSFTRVTLTAPTDFSFDENASIDSPDIIEIEVAGSSYANSLKIYPAIGTIRRQ